MLNYYAFLSRIVRHNTYRRTNRRIKSHFAKDKTLEPARHQIYAEIPQSVSFLIVQIVLSGTLSEALLAACLVISQSRSFAQLLRKLKLFLGFLYRLNKTR